MGETAATRKKVKRREVTMSDSRDTGLSAYLADIAKIPLLTPTEELRLATRGEN